MRLRATLLLLAALALPPAIGGCGSDSPTEPVQSLTQDDADDIVQQLATTSVGTGWGSFLLGGRTLPTPGASGSARVGPMRSQAVALWDTTFTEGALTYTFTFSFLDSALNVLSGFSPDSTWLIEEDSEIGGTVSLPGFEGSVSHIGNIEFTGMRAVDDTVEFAGTARDTAFSHFTAALRTAERWFHVDVVRTMDGVRLLKTGGSYPHAGSIRWIVTATRLRSASRADVEATLDAEAVLTFDGTRFPRLTITGGWTYTLDLLTGAIARI